MSNLVTKLRILATILSSTVKDSYGFWKNEVLCRKPNEPWCCNRSDCPCGNKTIRETFLGKKHKP